MSKKMQFRLLMGIAAVLMSIASWLTLKSTDGEFMSVSFIDVGQGDSALLRTPEGETILIDGGEQSAAKSCVEPYLGRKRIAGLKTVVASHMHSDHMGGLFELMKRVPVHRLVIPRADDDGWAKEKLLEGAERCGASVLVVSRQNGFSTDSENLKTEVLFPNNSAYRNRSGNKNNDSIVLRVSWFDTSFLFTGDLEADAEAVLVGSGQLKSDVLKVGHHGSSTSTSEEFLESVSPKYAVISAGRGNKYGHPHKEVTDRLDSKGVTTYRTDRDGTVEFLVDERGICEIRCESGNGGKEWKNGD